MTGRARWRAGASSTARRPRRGRSRGVARVVRSLSEVADIREGEILVCGSTSPAWSPIFSKIQATVTDVGGVMSHAAIVCREYGLPAVVGTGRATSEIHTGQRIRVNGTDGLVTPARPPGDTVTAAARHTRLLRELRAGDASGFGGKSASLGELLAAEIPVPPGVRARHQRVSRVHDERRIDRRARGRRGDARRAGTRRGADRARLPVCRAGRHRRGRGAAGGRPLERARRGRRGRDVRRPAGDVPLGAGDRGRLRRGPRVLGQPLQRDRGQLPRAPGTRPRRRRDGGHRPADGRRRALRSDVHLQPAERRPEHGSRSTRAGGSGLPSSAARSPPTTTW